MIKRKMYDVYVMDKETGEVIPSSEAVRRFYETHPYCEAWTDQYIELDEETEIEIEVPDFTKTINL